MNEQWQELKETIIEMRDNDGTLTQQEVCKFLANLMDVLEKQMSGSGNPNKWIPLNAKGNEPKEEGRYLLCLNDNYIDVVYYACQAWNFWFGIGQKPIAYMPLPEPYKAGEVNADDNT